MRRRSKGIIQVIGAASASIMLSSCQPPAPQILAMLESGRIVFHIRDRALITDRVFGWNDGDHDVDHFRVERGPETWWSFVPELPPPQRCEAGKTFPLVYGAARCGYRSEVGPDALRPGGPYRVKLGTDGSGGDWWSGSVLGIFSIRSDGTIDNLRPD